MGKRPVGFKLTLNTNKQAERAMRERVQQARGLVAETIADNAAEIVRSKIRGGGWLAIYRDAVKYFVNGDRSTWGVAGLWPRDLSTFPADATLVEFDGTDEVSVVLRGRNPWTIDQIPAISGGIRSDAKARPASPGDVDAIRDQLVAAKDGIEKALKGAGATLSEGEFPTIRGKTFADIAFMALALEHGQAGLPRMPHWVAAYRAAKSNAGKWAASVKARIDAVLDGEEKFEPQGREMPGDLEDALRDAAG